MLDIVALDKSLKLKALGRLASTKHPFLEIIRNKINLEDFYYPKLATEVDNVATAAVEILGEYRRETWNDEQYLRAAPLARALAGIELRNCINERGKTTLTYYMCRMRNKSCIRDLDHASFSQLKRFFVHSQLKDLLQNGLPNPRQEPLREEDKYLFPWRGKLKNLNSLSSKEIRMSRHNEPCLIFKAGVIMNPAESLTYFANLKKLTSVRHRNAMLRILHGDVYTNERLYRFGLIDNSRCDRCQEVDTLDHRLNSCQGTEVIRSCLTTLTSKLFKTLQIDQVEAIDQLLVTHKDCSKAILTVHAEILSKIVIGKQEIPRNPRNMLKNIVMQLIKKESGNEAKIDLQQLIPYL